MKDLSDWRQKLHHFFLISKSGKPLFSLPLTSEKEPIGKSDVFIGGFLSAITSFISNASNIQDPEKTFAVKDFNFLLLEHPKIIIAVVATEESEIIREKMRNFLKEFLKLYANLIKEYEEKHYFWEPIRYLVEKHFEVSFDKDKIQNLLEILSILSDIIQGTVDWSKVRQKVMNCCRKILDATVCTLFLKDETGNRIFLDAGVGFMTTDQILNDYIKNRLVYYTIGNDINGLDADGVTGYIVQTGKIVNVRSFDEVKKIPGWKGGFDNLIYDSEPERNFYNLIGVPLMTEDDEIIGVLKVENKRIKPGKPDYFDKNDEEGLKTLAAVIASATLAYQQKIVKKYHKAIFDHLHPFEAFNIHIRTIRDILKVEVCALYAIDLTDNQKKLILIGGEGYKKVIFPGSHTYDIGIKEDGSDADGVTAWIAQTGQEVLANSYEEVKAHPAHKGKWDEVQWDDKPEKYFKCLFGVPLISEEKILGVLKIENKIAEPRLFDSHDQQTLRDYAKIVAQELHKILQRDISLKMIDEYEYRLVRHKKRIFEKKAVGGVTLKHSLTSISPSEVDYFIHNKDPSKLDDRLPMPLGHETTAFVQYTKGNITYYFEPLTRIQQGDAVVVIPLIPCGSCEICTGGYGENYCMSSRFMASNAPGSLRTLYKYYKDLLLKIPINLDEKYALMTQPMSVVMQALMEFGFKEDSYRFPITYKKHHQTFPYFHVPQDDFTNIFNTITSAEPFPRTVFFIDTNDDKSKFEEKYYISLYNLQRKGLAIYGDDLYNFLDKRKELYGSNPKVLILGNGTVGYLMALLLSFVFKIPKERLYVTGRTDAKLDLFKDFAITKNVGMVYDENREEEFISFINDLARNIGKFNFVFDCVGHYAMAKNLKLAVEVVKEYGCIGLIGLEESNQPVNFVRIKEKKIYLKGFYRGSLEAYDKSLKLIASNDDLRERLNILIGPIHDIKNEKDLEEIFKKVEKRDIFGRHIVRLI